MKTGYKQTEIGVIPEDWEVKALGEIILRLNAGVSVNSEDDRIEGEKSILKTSCVSQGYFIPTECKKIISKDINRAKLNPKKDQIIISRMNTPDLVGECGYVSEDFNNLFLPDRLWATVFKKEIPTNARWLTYTISYENFSKKIKDSATGTSNSMKNLSKDSLLNLNVPFPPLPQQTAIAAALSDVDALMGELDKLIAKKRDIKQATMQQLLTGKKRLAGFSGEWEVKQLGELASIQRGASPRPIENPIWFDDNSSVGWVRISDVTKSGIFLEETTQKLSSLGVQNSRPVACGNLIMSICATVGRPIITAIDVCIHDGFVVFDNLRTDKHFLYYALKFIENDWSKHGQTGSQMNLNTTLINSTKIAVPPQEEQTAIATILSDMDAEISQLEARRAKTAQLKQGMMQELLTGRIRLVSNENLLNHT
jgi:type I restriction enzyme S subunit